MANVGLNESFEAYISQIIEANAKNPDMNTDQKKKNQNHLEQSLEEFKALKAALKK